MTHMLDTNICIYLIKRKPPRVLQELESHRVGDVVLSSITVAELEFGVQKSTRRDQNQKALDQFLGPLQIAEFDHDAAVTYGGIRAFLEDQGTPLGPLDTLIAAHARSLGLTMVTNNTGEFSRVPGLRVVNWAAP